MLVELVELSLKFLKFRRQVRNLHTNLFHLLAQFLLLGAQRLLLTAQLLLLLAEGFVGRPNCLGLLDGRRVANDVGFAVAPEPDEVRIALAAQRR